MAKARVKGASAQTRTESLNRTSTGPRRPRESSEMQCSRCFSASRHLFKGGQAIMYTQKVGSGECGKGTPRMPRLLVRFKSFVCVFFSPRSKLLLPLRSNLRKVPWHGVVTDLRGVARLWHGALTHDMRKLNFSFAKPFEASSGAAQTPHHQPQEGGLVVLCVLLAAFAACISPSSWVRSVSSSA